MEELSEALIEYPPRTPSTDQDRLKRLIANDYVQAFPMRSRVFIMILGGIQSHRVSKFISEQRKRYTKVLIRISNTIEKVKSCHDSAKNMVKKCIKCFFFRKSEGRGYSGLVKNPLGPMAFPRWEFNPDAWAYWVG